MALVCTWMGDRSGMSISADSASDETLNRGPLALLLRRQYEFPFDAYSAIFIFVFIFILCCTMVEYKVQNLYCPFSHVFPVLIVELL